MSAVFLLLFPIFSAQFNCLGQEIGFNVAETNAVRVRRSLKKSSEFLLKWMARKDESTSLLRDATVWQIDVHAARLFPQVVIAAHLTDPLALDGLLSETLRDEARLTSRIESLPDDYDLDSGSFVRTIVDTNKIRLQASRYIARGLLPITYVLGTSPWSARLEGLVEDLCALAATESPFSMGPVPSGDSEVNGNLLVALIWMGQETGDSKYIDLAYRIGDSYCLGIMPKNGGLPAKSWDWTLDRAGDPSLSLDNGGLSIVEGLVMLYVRGMRNEAERAAIYRPTLGHMLNVLLEYARTPGGSFYSRIRPDGRGGFLVDRKSETDMWPRLLQIMFEFGRLSANSRYIDPAVQAVRTYRSSEGTTAGTGTSLHLLNLILRLEENGILQPRGDSYVLLDSLATKIHSLASARLSTENDIESAQFHAGYAKAKSRGLRLVPWSKSLSWGVYEMGDTLYVTMESSTKWEGELVSGWTKETQEMDLASMMSPALTANWIGNEYRLETVDGNGRATWARRLYKMSLPVSLLPDQTLRVKIIRTGIEPLKLPPSPQALDRENEEHLIPAQRSVTDSSSHGH